MIDGLAGVGRDLRRRHRRPAGRPARQFKTGADRPTEPLLSPENERRGVRRHCAPQPGPASTSWVGGGLHEPTPRVVGVWIRPRTRPRSCRPSRSASATTATATCARFATLKLLVARLGHRTAPLGLRDQQPGRQPQRLSPPSLFGRLRPRGRARAEGRRLDVGAPTRDASAERRAPGRPDGRVRRTRRA